MKQHFLSTISAQVTRPTWGVLACLAWTLSSSLWAQTPSGEPQRMIVKYRDESAPMPAAVPNNPNPMPPLAEQPLHRLRLTAAALHLMVAQEKSMSFGGRVLSVGGVKSPAHLQRLAHRLAASDPNIEYAIPDRWIYLAQSAIPAPKLVSKDLQWPLFDTRAGIEASAAWQLFASLPQLGVTDPNFPIVAIIDSGYRPHVDLWPAFLGLNYVDGGDWPLDTGDARTAGQCPNLPSAQASTWHGLSVEGIIAARVSNGLGVDGVTSGGAATLHQRVFGPCGGYLSNYLAAIHDAVDFRNTVGQRVRVINLSQASQSSCEAPLQAEISRAVSQGVVVVASAGNDAKDAALFSPANCEGVISVGATDRLGNRAPYSNFGPKVTLSAPGGDSYSQGRADGGVLTTSLNMNGAETSGLHASDYGYVQGTSFAAPHVSAAAALILNLYPTLTVPQVRDLLVRTTKPLPGTCTEGCGAGLLDLRQAIEATQKQKTNAALCRDWNNIFSFCN